MQKRKIINCCPYFPCPLGLWKIHHNLQNISAYFMSNHQIKYTILNKLILLLIVITFLLTIIKRHSQLGIFSESSSSSKHNICSMIQFFMYNVPNFTQSTNPANVKRVCSASLWCTAALKKRNFKCEWRFKSINLFQ